jgi:hypothetical protein
LLSLPLRPLSLPPRPLPPDLATCVDGVSGAVCLVRDAPVLLGLTHRALELVQWQDNHHVNLKITSPTTIITQ